MASIKFFDAHLHVWKGTENRIGKFIESGQIDGMNLILAAPEVPWAAKQNREAFALKKKYGKRVQLAYWADPKKTGHMQELTKFLDEHPHVTGVKLHPVHGGSVPITEENFGAILDVAVERGLYVITHTQPTPGHSAICFDPLLRKRPGLRFILGHGSTMEGSAFMAAAHANCYVEPSWLGFFSPLFEMMERVGGHGKLLAGSDGPMWFKNFDGDPYEDIVQLARSYLPTMKEVRMFCYGNAEKFFGL